MWALTRAVDVAEPADRVRQAVGGCPGEQIGLAGPLRGPVGRQRRRDSGLRGRDRRLVAVQRAAGRGEDDRGAVLTGDLQHVQRPLDVDVAVAPGVRDRDRDHRLGAEVEDRARARGSRPACERLEVGDVEHLEVGLVGDALGVPVERSSTTTTSSPSASRRSTTCEPMKPAPPVTRRMIGEPTGQILAPRSWRLPEAGDDPRRRAREPASARSGSAGQGAGRDRRRPLLAHQLALPRGAWQSSGWSSTPRTWPEQIEEFARRRDRGPTIEVVVETEPLGTAGGVDQRARPASRAGRRFWSSTATWCRARTSGRWRTPRPRRRRSATLAVYHSDRAQEKGVVELDGLACHRASTRRTRIGPRAGSTPASTSSSRAGLPVSARGASLDFGFDLFPAALAAGRELRAHRLAAPVLDIGTPEDLARARALGLPKVSPLRNRG